MWKKIKHGAKTFCRWLLEIVLGIAATSLIIMVAIMVITYGMTSFAVTAGITTDFDMASLMLFLGFPGLFLTLLLTVGIIWILKQIYQGIDYLGRCCFSDKTNETRSKTIHQQPNDTDEKAQQAEHACNKEERKLKKKGDHNEQ